VPVETPDRLVVIGASTGGPRAVQRILMRLPDNLPAPILVVQHIANGFTQGLADWLSGETALRVAVAREGEGLAAGRVYVAPEGRHMMPERKTIQLSTTPRTSPIPSVDVTMQAAARSWGAAAIGVLLTGMGSDGARGLLSIRQAGGTTIAQDQATSTIFGMPQAAIQLKAVLKVLPLDEIAAAIEEAVSVSNGHR
jgi:two-component system chemotaxis response regulator CheB